MIITAAVQLALFNAIIAAVQLAGVDLALLCDITASVQLALLRDTTVIRSVGIVQFALLATVLRRLVLPTFIYSDDELLPRGSHSGVMRSVQPASSGVSGVDLMRSGGGDRCSIDGSVVRNWAGPAKLDVEYPTCPMLPTPIALPPTDVGIEPTFTCSDDVQSARASDVSTSLWCRNVGCGTK